MSRPIPHSVRASSNTSVAALRPHPLEGRHLISFSKGSGFLDWCGKWGDIIQFKRLQYCKFNGAIGHEFILLHDMHRNPRANPTPEVSQQLELWSSLESGLGNKICKFERMGDPEAPLDAFLSSSAAFDYVSIYDKDLTTAGPEVPGPDQGVPDAPGASHSRPPFAITSAFPVSTARKQLEKTHVLLDIIFPEAHTLTEVLDICYRISCHDKSCDYTLLQFNCYFFCWNIILGLTRGGALWEATLANQSGAITEAVLDRLREFASSESQRYNLALVLSGHHSTSNAASSSAFMEQIAGRLRSDTFHEALRARVASILWVRDQRAAVDATVREFLDQAADATVDLFCAGTGEETLDSLLRRNTPLDLGLSSDWNAVIQAEFNRLFQLYLGAEMWSNFGSSLQQTKQARRQYVETKQLNQDLSLLQKTRYSQPVLTARLWPLGWKTIMNNARVAASIDVPDRKTNPIEFALKTLKHTPEQYMNLARVTGDFVSVAGAGMKMRAAAGQAFKISGIGDNVLQLVGNVKLEPEETEGRVTTELATSVENMAKHMAEKHPDQYNQDALRKASLQLLSNLKTKGHELSLFIDPQMLWRLGLWYFLGGDLIGSILEIGGGLCEQSEPSIPNSESSGMTSCELKTAEIQQWISGRIRDLSRRALKQVTVQAEPCQREIERTISEIWADGRSWYNLRT
ncbi:hypothetical protein FRC06_001425 [Ceratobasidium sp. 370]|nr:hypothetical protein FRC06_001425 [Ceratobasidium sp. 370]